MKKRILRFMISLSACLIWLTGAYGQPLEIFQDVQINSSPNPIGSGARAQGMGGAFIAVADDATAASWNPGGLMQLERPEFSFALSFDHRRKDYNSSRHPEASAMNEIYREDLNYFSVAYPFRAFDKNMVVSLNYQRLYDFYDDIEFDQNFRQVSSGTFRHIDTHTKFKQTGALKALSPAFAVQLTPRLSVGLTFNFWTDNLGYDNEWNSERITTARASFHGIFTNSVTGQKNLILSKFRTEQVREEENDDFEGFNMNIGFLWHINRVITLGGVLKTPFTADFDRKTIIRTNSFSYSATRLTAPLFSSFETKESLEMKFPMSYGIGLAFRLSDAFTVAFDVYRTHWSDFWLKSENGSSSPITGKHRNESHVHDTTQVRIGCEYLFILEKTIVPLRLGAFYDPEPSEKIPEDYFGISVGTGIMLGNVVLDCAYVFRWGRDVKGDTLGIPQTKADVDQHSLFISMIYHF